MSTENLDKKIGINYISYFQSISSVQEHVSDNISYEHKKAITALHLRNNFIHFFTTS
jgi:hypothetical protein